MFRTLTSRPHAARRCEVPPEALRLQTLSRPDYQDAFCVEVDPRERRSVIGWARGIFEEQALPVEALLVLVGLLLRLPPGPLRSPDHVLGMKVVEHTEDAGVGGGDGPAVGLRIVIMAPAGNRPLTMSTFLQINDARWRPVVRLLLIGHRRVVPLLLNRVAARAAFTHLSCVTA
jgi:hypothetical protein